MAEFHVLSDGYLSNSPSSQGAFDVPDCGQRTESAKAPHSHHDPSTVPSTGIEPATCGLGNTVLWEVPCLWCQRNEVWHFVPEAARKLVVRRFRRP